MSATIASLLPRPIRLPAPPVTTRVRSQLEAFLVLRRNPLELWGQGAYEEGVIAGRFLGRDQILVNDPEAIRHVLVGNAENYGRSAGGLRILRPVIGNGLFLAEGKAWRHQRRTIAPALAPRTMPLLARHVVAASEAAEAALAALGGRPVELLPQLQRLALNIAAKSMFSLDATGFAAELRAVLFRYARLSQPGLLDLVLPERIATPADRRRAAFRREWVATIDRVIDARERQGGLEGAPRDLFELLRAAEDPETRARFDRATLRDEVATMILAGHETTAVTLFWSCWLAARLPEMGERIAAEAAGVDLSAEGAGEAMRALPYTRAFVDEALRLYPPAFLIVREARGDDVLPGGQAVRRGSVLSIAPWVLHRHRRFWERPEEFDPGRFLPGQPAPARYSYLPFGAGPRVCVGAQFALTEAVIVLARLLRRFRLSFSGSGAVVPRGFVTTQPDRPVRFMLTPR